ncbi:MAG: hypothetical protein ACI9YL_000031 [Luteibaculaceae bacterium]|jgi:hypothetical protein
MKKLLVLFSASLLIGNIASAQTFAKTTEPTVLFEDQKVEVKYHYQNCEKPWNGTKDEMVYLDITNKTDKELTLTWINERYYGPQCYGCDKNPEMLQTITLAPKETQSGGCSRIEKRALEVTAQKLDFPFEHALSKLRFALQKTE